jgi:thioesterase domain-containing protein
MYWLTTMFPGITSWAPPGMDLGAMPTAREYTPIVPMKPTGSRPPFFLVHGGFGSVFPYHHLSVHMGEDQPLYGLQARGLDGREAPLDSIPDMAASYAEAIQATCPQGPYHLGGYSFGGWVAYEIAQILARSGGEVGLLAFFGIGAPFSVIGGPMVEQLSYWSQFFEDAFNLARQKGKMGLGGLGQHPPELREMLPPMWRVLFAALKAQSRYFPEPWPGSAELFFTREQEPAFRWFPALGWERLCGDVVGRHPVPGTHLKMFQESNVQIVARELTQLLEERS